MQGTDLWWDWDRLRTEFCSDMVNNMTTGPQCPRSDYTGCVEHLYQAVPPVFLQDRTLRQNDHPPF